MLVLSRREKETLVFPALNIQIEILRTQGNRVRVGVDAPRDIQIVRGELMKDGQTPPLGSPGKKSPSQSESSINKAALILNQLEILAQQHQWGEAEPRVYNLFRELESLDGKSNGKNLDRKKANSKKRAMLVDDNDNESKLLSSYLRLKGFEVDRVDNGKTAMIHLGNETKPDVVLLDMCMPRFDGRWTISQIRQNAGLCDTRVYAVSGLDQQASGVEIGPMGVNEWFTKPLNPEELIDAISSDYVTTAV